MQDWTWFPNTLCYCGACVHLCLHTAHSCTDLIHTHVSWQPLPVQHSAVAPITRAHNPTTPSVGAAHTRLVHPQHSPSLIPTVRHCQPGALQLCADTANGCNTTAP